MDNTISSCNKFKQIKIQVRRPQHGPYCLIIMDWHFTFIRFENEIGIKFASKLFTLSVPNL